MHPRQHSSWHNLHFDHGTKRCRLKDPKCVGSGQRSSVCRPRNQSKPLSAPSHSTVEDIHQTNKKVLILLDALLYFLKCNQVCEIFIKARRVFAGCSGPVKTSYRQPFLQPRDSSSITIKHTATPPHSLSTQA